MDKIKNKGLDKVKQTPIQVPDADLMQLADKIVAVIEMGKQQLAISINQTIKSTYWNVGRHIVEFEQQGNARAKYGICGSSISCSQFVRHLTYLSLQLVCNWYVTGGSYLPTR